MCIFNTPSPKAITPPPAIEGRVDDSAGTLPDQKDIVKPDQKSGVQYGSSKKESGQAAGNLSGASSLKIPLSTGAGEAGSKTGGLNV